MKRLVIGYKANVKPSKIHASLSDTFSLLKVPDWQKSDKWVDSSEAEWCGRCNIRFSLLKQKSHCRVCGSVYCGQCINTDLMVYFDDTTGHATWALTGFVGCPDNEPSVCMYLHVCLICHDEIQELQVQDHYARDIGEPAATRLPAIDAVLRRLDALRSKLETQLTRYQELVDTMADGGIKSPAGSGQSNVQVFAKLQVDLSDLFTQFFIVVQSLKEIPVSTKAELKVMGNVMKDKCSYYNGQMLLFKGLKDALHKVLPSSALDEVQHYANKQAINSAFILTRQLGLEALHFATLHCVETLTAMKISEVDQVCFDELRRYVQETGDDWDCHAQALKEIVKERLSTKRLIAPPSTTPAAGAADRSVYLRWLLIQRTTTVLAQVLQALEAKSAENKFRSSKRVLEQTMAELSAENKAISTRHDRSRSHRL